MSDRLEDLRKAHTEFTEHPKLPNCNNVSTIFLCNKFNTNNEKCSSIGRAPKITGKLHVQVVSLL